MTEALSAPPSPVQLRLYVLVALGATLMLPVVFLLPDQAPEAVQPVALLADQLRVVDSPALMPVSARLSETAGGSAGAGVTLTVTLSLALPPSPLQLSVNVLLPVNGPTVRDPEVLLPPDQAPEALQPSAFVVDQVSVTLSPSSTVVLEALSATVGAAGSVTWMETLSLRVPPGPVQVNV